MKEKIQQLINKKIDNKNIFGIGLRIENDKDLIFNGNSGNIKLDSKYFIASTTKIYTSGIIMKLKSENQLSLDDKLSKYFSKDIVKGLNVYKGVDYSDDITIRSLLSHTSGIPDYFSGKRNGKSLEQALKNGIDSYWDFNSVIKESKKQRSKFKPNNGKALYSDTNYQLLGRIIELIRAQDITSVFNEEIFKVLGLDNTYLYSDINDKSMIPLYYKSKPLYIPKAMSSFKADGSIVSTSEESMKYLKAFFNGKIFPKEYISEMIGEEYRIFFPLKYGIGLMKFDLPIFMTMFKKYPPLFGHSGLSGAFSYYSPDLNLYFTGTVNQINNPSSSYRLLIELLNLVKNND